MVHAKWVGLVHAPSRPVAVSRQRIVILFAVLYAIGAGLSAWNVITRTEKSTGAIDQILSTYNMKNEGALALDRYSKEHPILSTLFGSPVRHELELPTKQESVHALDSGMAHLLKTVRQESFSAAWWSWFLLNLSLFYVASLIFLERHLAARSVLVALTFVSLTCFVIGVLAPAMVIWTAPSIPMETGNLSFVLQHEIRGIAAIIWELLTSGHWIIGGFLLLFSLVTPLTKALLTLVANASHSRKLNFRIGAILHAIGKWSMADVFVAGVLLALYALKAQEATKSIPCLGLYYFIGYCLLSMTTTELLTHSGVVDEKHEKKPSTTLGSGAMTGVFAVVLCFLVASTCYTYQQYTENTRQHITASTSPQSLDNADLVLPAHK